MNQRQHDSESMVPIDRVVKPLRAFFENKLAGAILLIAGTVIALVWANSPWAGAYHHLLHMDVGIEIGSAGLTKSLHHWINDGLMGIFFFVVGLEIKREVIGGELSTIRRAMLPIAGAVGGMLVPAAVYALWNFGGEGAAGWGIPMATDIAFALGVLALLGNRVPLGLKVFLTALAIVDDIGAILVIAVFYTDSISIFSLVAGGVGFLVAVGANRAGVRNPIVYFVLGALVWLMFLKSGVHATLAAVLMAMTIPARAKIRGERVVERLREQVSDLSVAGLPVGHGLVTPTAQHLLEDLGVTIQKASGTLQRLEHGLMPIVTFVVLPVFALANAGVALGAEMGEVLAHPATIGVAAGLFLGKQLGIFAFAFLVVKLGLAELPAGVTWRQLHAVAILGGIGFTMSLFIGGLAFNDPALVDASKVGILAGSLVSAVVGTLMLRSAVRSRS